MNRYDKLEYWEDRYQKDPEPFDWYQRFNGLREHIIQQVSTNFKILNIGAGTSRLCEELYLEGFQNIHNVDFSPTVVSIMKDKYKEMNMNVQYLQMDIKKMDKFADRDFDTVFDKGTLDSIYCGDSANENIQKALSEVYRVLKPKGVFLCLSHSLPEHRLAQLQQNEFNWKIQSHQINKINATIQISLGADEQKENNIHTLYICHKYELDQ